MNQHIYDEEAAAPVEPRVASSAISQSNCSIWSDDTAIDYFRDSYRGRPLLEKVYFREESANLTALPVLATNDIRQEATQAFALPKKAGSRVYRFVRWNFFSTYRRLFTIVTIINASYIIAMFAKPDHFGQLSYTGTSSAAALNIAVALVTRHEHTVNFLFTISSSLPLKAPLFLRKLFAKIYSYGGIHSGTGLASVVWYLIFTGLVTKHLLVEPYVRPAVAVLTYLTLTMLVLISIFAHPTLRNKFHNSFEATHRFAGWTVLGLFWAQVILLADAKRDSNHSSLGTALLGSMPVYCLIISTLCVVYPWVRLRKRACSVQYCSDHAVIVHFGYARLSWGSAIRISHNPLEENHAFAVIPEPPGKKGFSVVISDAGDWTKRVIQDPPRQFWVKGAPALGVIRVSAMFSPVLIVATGSGIGPCLSFFRGCPGHPCRVLWSTPTPVETYGEKLVQDVYRADAHAMIIDTRSFGRPDLVALSYRLFKQSNCEAVVVISNQKVTRKLVYGLETRGVPAYGPIFDS